MPACQCRSSGGPARLRRSPGGPDRRRPGPVGRLGPWRARIGGGGPRGRRDGGWGLTPFPLPPNASAGLCFLSSLLPFLSFRCLSRPYLPFSAVFAFSCFPFALLCWSITVILSASSRLAPEKEPTPPVADSGRGAYLSPTPLAPLFPSEVSLDLVFYFNVNNVRVKV